MLAFLLGMWVTGLALPASWAQPARVRDDLLRQEIPGSLGLPVIAGSHRQVYDARSGSYHYSHHANLVVYRDRLYGMWSSGLVGEDENGQRILWSHSRDGDAWTQPAVLIDDPDGAGPLGAIAAGFHATDKALVAYYSAREGSRGPPNNSVYAIVSSDSEVWSAPRKVFDGFFIESPRRLPSGRLLMNGQFHSRAPRLSYTDSSDGLSGWKDATIPDFPDFKPAFPEPNWWLRRDGTLVMLFRAVNSIPWLYASISRDEGRSWSMPERTNLPSATARMATGNLPDGRAFCIWNPSQKFGRVPLVIALSRDGELFDQAFVLRGEPTTKRFEGKHKNDGWQYPSALIWRDALWVMYSENKENIWITRIPLSDLQ